MSRWIGLTPAGRSIGQRITDYKLIVHKSTVLVGTGDRVEATIGEAPRSCATATACW